jgi:hypothetical protein
MVLYMRRARGEEYTYYSVVNRTSGRVEFSQPTRLIIPEDNDLHARRYENLSSHL